MVLFRFGCSIYKNLSSDENLQQHRTNTKTKYNPRNPQKQRKQTKTRTVFKKTGRKSGRNKHNTRFYISVPGNSLQDKSKDQQSII